MEIKRCKNGHYYDPSISSLCPMCASIHTMDFDLDWEPVDAKDPRTWQDQLRMLSGSSRMEKISSGSTCDVYRVEMAGKVYALKVMDCGSDENKLRCARYEIYIMEKVRTRVGLVHLIDSEILYSGAKAIVFLLEEYARSFEDYYKNNPVTIRDVVRLGAQVCQALDACWRAGVAHLDVQPKNIFVGENGRFLLGDFGSSLTVDLLEGEQQLRGTLSYMAPEVYHARQYSQASDVYSLGIVLYTILNNGMLPFADRMPKEAAIRERLKGTPLPPLTRYGNGIWKVLSRACAYQPNQRYWSFNTLLGALVELMMDEKDCSMGASVKQNRLQEDGYFDAASVAAPRTAAPAPKKAAKKGLFGALASMFQKEHSVPVASSMPRPVPPAAVGTGNLFEEEAVRCDAPASWEGGDLFNGNSVGCTVPLSGPGGNLFDADSFASTCALGYAPTMPCPPAGNLFDADSFACTAPLTAPSPAAWEEEEMEDGASSWESRKRRIEPAAGNLFDADSFANTCAMMPPPAPMAGFAPSAPAAPRMDQVQFSAVAPKEAMKGEYSIIQIFMYEQAFRSVVEEALEMMETEAQEKKSGIHKVLENTRVKIVLSCKEMEIEDNELEQVWCGGYLQFDFAICPPEDLKKRQLLLTAQVYFDDVPATRLMLTVRPTASYDEQIEMARQDIITAFVSYASQDRARVGALVQGMRKARPDMDIFFDVTTLRSGDDWESALYREIARRDILFLCWSRYARESEWVEREWRYALAQKGSDCIEPIPLEQPDICPPPRELSSKHFNDSLLYIINR